MTFEDVISFDTWNEYVYQEAYEKNPEQFRHKGQWDDADHYVFDLLTDKQQRYLEQINIV